MRVDCKIRGLEQVTQRLNAAAAQIKGACEAGLVTAALEIRAEAQKLTPVVTGNLRNSAFVTSRVGPHGDCANPKFKPQPGKPNEVARLSQEHQSSLANNKSLCRYYKNPTVRVGYSAYYAVFVHENISAGKTSGVSLMGQEYKTGTYSKVGQWKFLETAIRNNMSRLMDIIAYKARAEGGRRR